MNISFFEDLSCQLKFLEGFKAEIYLHTHFQICLRFNDSLLSTYKPTK